MELHQLRLTDLDRAVAAGTVRLLRQNPRTLSEILRDASAEMDAQDQAEKYARDPARLPAGAPAAASAMGPAVPVSNKRRLPREVPPGIAACARAARYSDCHGRGQARFRDGQWEIKFWHSGGCPAYTGTTHSALHADAKASVARAAEATGTELTYEAIGDEQGLVGGSGLVTAPGSGLTRHLSSNVAVCRCLSRPCSTVPMGTCSGPTGGATRPPARAGTRGARD